jgi:hypothetical protein
VVLTRIKWISGELYYAMLDDAYYVSPREDCLHELIDRSLASRGKERSKAETVAVNSSVYVAPGAQPHARAALAQYLEWETHRRALANGPLWYALYRSGVLSADASEETRRRVADRFFGYVPISPDGSSYRYDARAQEVVNARHGSLQRPQLHDELADKSPLNKLLAGLHSVRADLRFREDGVATVLTFSWQQPTK